MKGLGTIVNAGSILAGGLAGLLLRTLIPQRVKDAMTQTLGLTIAVIGVIGIVTASVTAVDGTLQSRFVLTMIFSLTIGALAGELIRIEDRLEGFARLCQDWFTRRKKDSDFSQGFVTSSLVFCVGAMAVVGAIEDGLNGNTDILFAKAILDGVLAIFFASSMGVGVLLSAAMVGLYQGFITLAAVLAASSIGPDVADQLSFVGSILILGIGFNMMKITSIKIGNLLPSMLIPVVLSIF